MLLYVFRSKGSRPSSSGTSSARLPPRPRWSPGSDVVAEVAARVDRVLHESPWMRPGGVRVDALVVGADGRTLLYAGGGLAGALATRTGSPVNPGPLLPPRIDVIVTVAHNSLVANGILVGYAGAPARVLFGNARRAERRRSGAWPRRLAARPGRGACSAHRGELEAVRERLCSAETGQASDAER